MDALTLVLFVGAVWVLGAIGFFAWNLRQGAPDHADRLALLPIEDNWTDPREASASALDVRPGEPS